MMNGKQAYLIMAHNNFYCLETLLKMLDSEQNDIFIHIDIKAGKMDFDYFKKLCVKSEVVFTKKRYNVKWGHRTQIKNELALFSLANKHGSYSYYHLISGSDLPLMKVEKINSFYSGDRIYMAHKVADENLRHRVSIYNFSHHGRLFTYLNYLQLKLGTDRLKNSGLCIQKGANWGDFTPDAVSLLLRNKKSIMKMTRFSLCADEVYKQTFIMSSPLADRVDECIHRYMIWKTDHHPETITVDNFDEMIGSGCFFARKFDENQDRAVIDKIYNEVMNHG